jgi:hypothetical protein
MHLYTGNTNSMLTPEPQDRLDDAARDAVALVRALVEGRESDLRLIEANTDVLATLRAMTSLAEVFLSMYARSSGVVVESMLDAYQSRGVPFEDPRP